MSTFATENRLLTLYDLPVAAPEVLIQPGEWLGIATAVLPAKAKLDLLWLSALITGSLGTGKPVVNTNFLPGGLVTVYLINNWSPDAEPWSQTALTYLPAGVAGSTLPVSSSVSQTITTTAPGNYTVVLCNNTTNLAYSVTVCGALTIDTDP